MKYKQINKLYTKKERQEEEEEEKEEEEENDDDDDNDMIKHTRNETKRNATQINRNNK